MGNGGKSACRNNEDQFFEMARNQVKKALKACTCRA
jgi:hypothetical protein